MLEITSTPLILVGILGTVGVLLPLISIARHDRGSSSFYAVIAFGALIVSIGYVGYQIVSEHVLPAAVFSEDVLVDDMFGGFFAIAMLIVAIMTTVGSFNYMRNKAHPAVYFSLILYSFFFVSSVSLTVVSNFLISKLITVPSFVKTLSIYAQIGVVILPY